ncbi:ParB/Srx family N-terminal domain-containing protein [Thalassospira sp. MA62]|nr:ParB/Srx family N-terminal domain-containing protein [Thalassospira sp. MA62]
MAFSEMQWEKRTIPLEQIELDPENPRLAPDHQSSDMAALTYLVEHENVLGLARNIADYKNLYPHESIICIPIENDKYLVVEGNRRVAACKLLLKPHFIGEAGDENDIPKIDQNTKTALSELHACIADTRQTADEIIAKLHIDEFGKLSWNTRKKIRYVESRLRFGNEVEELAENLGVSTNNLYKLKAHGRIFKYVSSMLNWTPRERDVIWDDKVDLDIMLSVLSSKVIPIHFGHILFSDAGEINYDFPDRDEICKRIVQHTLISQKLHVDYKFTRNTAVRDYLHERFPRKAPAANSNFTFNLTPPSDTLDTVSTGGSHIVGGVSSSEEQVTEAQPEDFGQSPEASDGSRYDRPSLLNALRYSNTTDARLKQLASEAKRISQLKPAQVISLSFLMRAILERGLLLEVKRSGLFDELRQKHSDKPSLDDLIKFCVQKKKSGMTMSRQLIRSVENANNDGTIFELHQNIHGGFGNLTPERLKIVCGAFLPIFDYFLENN